MNKKYTAKKDEEGNEELVKKAMPTAVIPGSFATPSLLASIIDKKFTQSLPFISSRAVPRKKWNHLI